MPDGAANIHTCGPRSVHRVSPWAAFLISSLALLASGCQAPPTQFEVVSFKDRPDGEYFAEVFEDGYYSQTPENNWTLVFEIPPSYVDIEAPAVEAGEPVAAASTPVGAAPPESADAEGPGLSVIKSYAAEDEESEAPKLKPRDEPTARVQRGRVPVRMSQLVVIEVFWRAKPGTTFAESSQTNANIVYCLTTGRDSITYEGAGFVSFQESGRQGVLQGRIESAALYPARITGAPADLFGRCRLSGTFTARSNRAKTIALTQALRKRVGPPIGTDTALAED